LHHSQQSGRRPLDTAGTDRFDWIRHLRDLCLASGTAFFFKQYGGLTPKSGGNTLDGRQWLEFPKP
jgi:protein gp37